jgi:tRNA nucleotidyltransferase/poly(A) polymerase
MFPATFILRSRDMPRITSLGERALEIAAALHSNGYQAWLVGGCVRDLVLGREPKDYDIATDAVPSQVIELFPGAVLVGAQFGVVLVDGVEVATFRSDHAYHDGRHPERVVFEKDVKQDVLRRDFTINGLLLDLTVLPNPGRPIGNRPQVANLPHMSVVDHVGGLGDLEKGIIRAIGDPERRFQEDHLRMLRAVRFAARFGFEIEPATMAAIQKLRANIGQISGERMRDEIVRILTEGHPRRGFELLDESGLLSEIMPEVAALKGVQQPPEFHPEGDVWVHTMIMLDNLPERPPATLALGVLLHDVGKPPTFRVADRIRFDGHVEAGQEIGRDILRRLRFSNDEVEQVIALIGNHMRFAAVTRMRESTVKRFLRLPKFEEHLELHRLDCVSSHGGLENYDFMRRKIEELPPEQLRPPRLLTGADLIAAGYTPGPEFSKMLEAAEDAQLEGRVRTREEALEMVRSMGESNDGRGR